VPFLSIVNGEFASPTAAKPLAVDVPGAVDLSGLSRAQLYKDMRDGRLVAHKRGKRTLILVSDLENYLRALPRAKFKPVPEA
jgi:hypothetical protein